MGKLSYMSRTLAALRARGDVPAVVERWIPGAGIRSDLLGIIDVLAFDPALGRVVGVQVCGRDFAAHRRKITTEHAAEARLWLTCAGPIEIWGWRKTGPRGGRKVWTPRVVEIGLHDLAE